MVLKGKKLQEVALEPTHLFSMTSPHLKNLTGNFFKWVKQCTFSDRYRVRHFTFHENSSDQNDRKYTFLL